MRSIVIVLFCGMLMMSQLVGQNRSVKSDSTGLQWDATPIPGLEMAVVSGDPRTQGSYVLRIRAVKEVRVPPNWRPTVAKATVLAGAVSLGEGERFNSTSLQQLQAGDSVTLQKDVRYFAALQPGTDVQLQGDGPVVANWVDSNALKALKSNDVDSNSERTKMKAEQDKR